MNPFVNLSEDNQVEILKYIKFFRQKKDGIVRALKSEFCDFKNDKLSKESVFSKDDLEEFADILESEVRVSRINIDFQYLIESLTYI
jgi:hypothetical protein